MTSEVYFNGLRMPLSALSYSIKHPPDERPPLAPISFRAECHTTIDGADAWRFIDVLFPCPAGASDRTLAIRSTYNNRKGRSARRRLAERGLKLCSVYTRAYGWQYALLPLETKTT